MTWYMSRLHDCVINHTHATKARGVGNAHNAPSLERVARRLKMILVHNLRRARIHMCTCNRARYARASLSPRTSASRSSRRQANIDFIVVVRETDATVGATLCTSRSVWLGWWPVCDPAAIAPFVCMARTSNMLVTARVLAYCVGRPLAFTPHALCHNAQLSRTRM